MTTVSVSGSLLVLFMTTFVSTLWSSGSPASPRSSDRIPDTTSLKGFNKVVHGVKDQLNGGDAIRRDIQIPAAVINSPIVVCSFNKSVDIRQFCEPVQCTDWGTDTIAV